MRLLLKIIDRLKTIYINKYPTKQKNIVYHNVIKNVIINRSICKWFQWYTEYINDYTSSTISIRQLNTIIYYHQHHTQYLHLLTIEKLYVYNTTKLFMWFCICYFIGMLAVCPHYDYLSGGYKYAYTEVYPDAK